MECLTAIMSDVDDAGTNRLKRRCAGPGQQVVGTDVTVLEERLARVERLITAHDHKLRETEAYLLNTYFLPKESELGSAMNAAFSQWQSKRPSKGVHPFGHVKLIMAATMLDKILKATVTAEVHGPELAAQHASLQQHAQKYAALQSLEAEVHHCSCRLTKKEDKYVMKMQWLQCSTFSQYTKLIETILAHAFSATKQYGPEPKGSIVRDIENHLSDRCRSGGA